MNAQKGEYSGLLGDRTGLTKNCTLLPELSDRRDLDDWLSGLLNSKREVKGYESESDCEDDNPDEDCSQSGGEAALNKLTWRSITLKNQLRRSITPKRRSIRLDQR